MDICRGNMKQSEHVMSEPGHSVYTDGVATMNLKQICYQVCQNGTSGHVHVIVKT